jgi:hypothetical protein
MTAMEENIMIFDKTPSALYSLWKAFRSRKSIYSPDVTYPIVHSVRKGLIIYESHLKAFYKICDIIQTDVLHILYPFALAYPYIMRVMGSQKMPVSMFKTLNTRNSIVMHRPIRHDERLDIDCYNGAPRIISKGLEMDVNSVVYSGKETVWENITTYFYPGNFGPEKGSYSAPKLEPIDNAPIIKEWYLPAKDRFKFARISGDSNGIHYGSFYARMMGFKRDFAQPIRVVAKCVSSLPHNNGEIRGWLEEVVANCFAPASTSGMDCPVRLDFYLKGPVYYQSTLILKNIRTAYGNRFDLYCSGNEKPVICGMLYNKRAKEFMKGISNADKRTEIIG